MSRSTPDLWAIQRVEQSSALLAPLRGLLREYAQWLDVDLCFQSFEQELQALPGEYQFPLGGLWVAGTGESPVQACVALRSQSGTSVAELKRLYVSPRARGGGLGRRLTECAMDFARQRGYSSIRLDTLPQMPQAQALYESLGFLEIAPYYFNPILGARYLECKL
jgi:putative acetyltransferase